MRYIRFLILAAFGLALVVVSVANLGTVELKLVPDIISGDVQVDPRIQLPLFVVILGSIVVGIVVGFAWEWLRETGHRRHEAQLERECRKLNREIKKLKSEKNEGKDEVLAILDEAV